MASAGANAERQAKAQAAVNAHMERIGRATGIQPPPPIVRVSHADERSMADTERTAAFMGLVADALDPSNAGKTQQLPQSLGGVGEYNAQEEEAKAAAKAKGNGGAGEASADESPVSDSNADEAAEQISRMRSPDKLRAIAENDKRQTVKAAAQARLDELGQ